MKIRWERVIPQKDLDEWHRKHKKLKEVLKEGKD